MLIATCIGCGCDDNHACRDAFDDPCYWLRVDYKAGIGVCSECPQKVDSWDAIRAEFIASNKQEQENFINQARRKYDLEFS